MKIFIYVYNEVLLCTCGGMDTSTHLCINVGKKRLRTYAHCTCMTLITRTRTHTHTRAWCTCEAKRPKKSGCGGQASTAHRAHYSDSREVKQKKSRRE